MTARKDPIKLVENARLTEEETEALFYHLAEKMKPKTAVAPKLIHFAETVEEANTYLAEDGQIIGLSTGWDSIDQMFMGMKPGELEVVYGDTKHRKSMFVQNIAAQVADAGHPVLFVGLELIGAQNTERWLKMGYDNLDIFYPESPPEYKDIDALVKVATEEAGVELVIVDHLHMWRGEGENKAEAITDICIEMKRVAMKYRVPLILVSHTSRDKTATGPPSVNLLKGSTSISQLADKVICVYSPGVEFDGPDNVVEVSIPLSRRLPNKRSATLAILPSARLQ